VTDSRHCFSPSVQARIPRDGRDFRRSRSVCKVVIQIGRFRVHADGKPSTVSLWQSLQREHRLEQGTRLSEIVERLPIQADDVAAALDLDEDLVERQPEIVG
jgi:hypothetical protein